MKLAQDIKSMYELNHLDIRKIFALEWAKSCRKHNFRKHVDQEDLIQGFYLQLMHRKTLECGFDYTVPNPSAQFATYMYTCVCTYIKDYMQRDRRHSLGMKADTFKNSDGINVLVSESLVGVHGTGSGDMSGLSATAEYGQDFVWSGTPAANQFCIKDFCCEVAKDTSMRKEDREKVAQLIHGLNQGMCTQELTSTLTASRVAVLRWKKHAKEIYKKYVGDRGK